VIAEFICPAHTNVITLIVSPLLDADDFL
jgi:hypothetical protein